MKLWQFALIQLILVGSFLYVVYTPSSYSSKDNFLQDPDNTIIVTHKSSSSNKPTTSPSNSSSQDSSSTSSTQSPTNQTGASSSIETSPGSSIAVGEPEPSGGTSKTPTNPPKSTNTTNNTYPNQSETESRPTQTTQTTSTTPSSSNNATTSTGAIPDPPAPGQPVDPNVPQNQPQNPNLPPEEPHSTTETPSQPTEEPQQPTETETNPTTTWPTNTTRPVTPHDGPFRGGRPVAAPGATSTSIKGSEEEPKIIFKSKQENNGTCSQTNQRQVKLCKMSLRNNCKRYHVSEELSSWWIICPIYTANNEQTDRLYELHVNFRNYIKSFGINFQTVEVLFPGQNEFMLTEPNNQPYDLQYYSEWIFAMRENLVNVGIKHLPEDWQFMSWIDQHIFWVDPYWFEKTILAFSHYNIVHMLNGNDFWNLENRTDYSLDGFARIWTEIGMGFVSRDPRQCGLAWGMRREIFEKLGGLLDICIGTKCDLYQNYAYIGSRYAGQVRNQEYAQMISEWQDHAIKVYDRKLGFVDTKVVHFMHCTGSCQTSQYHLHVWALMQYNYNPKWHIKRDGEGRMSLVNNLPLALKLWELYGGPPR